MQEGELGEYALWAPGLEEFFVDVVGVRHKLTQKSLQEQMRGPYGPAPTLTHWSGLTISDIEELKAVQTSGDFRPIGWEAPDDLNHIDNDQTDEDAVHQALRALDEAPPVPSRDPDGGFQPRQGEGSHVPAWRSRESAERNEREELERRRRQELRAREQDGAQQQDMRNNEPRYMVIQSDSMQESALEARDDQGGNGIRPVSDPRQQSAGTADSAGGNAGIGASILDTSALSRERRMQSTTDNGQSLGSFLVVVENRHDAL